MKKTLFTLAALLLAGALSLPAAASSAGRPLLLESGQALYDREADDFLNLESIRDGGSWKLFEPLYADEGDYILQVQCPYGAGSLSAETLEGNVSVNVKRLRPENEPARVKYTYYAVTLLPSDEPDTDADEDFSIRLQYAETGVTLTGTVQKSRVLSVFEGVRYRAQSGALFRFDEALKEEEALITCAPGLTLSFLGDYGRETYDLKVDTQVPAEAVQLLGTEQLTCYRFTGAPSFDEELTVWLQAPENTTIYELRNGRLYELNTVFEDTCHHFKTSVPGTYLYRNF